MKRKVLIVDTETGGLGQAADLLEVGFVVFCLKSRSVITQASWLIPGTKNGAEHINHIPQVAIEATGGASDGFKALFLESLLHVDAIVSHNNGFDRAQINKYLGTHPSYANLPWVESMKIAYPKAGKSKKLIHLAADHDIPTIGAHRALADAVMVAKLFEQTPDIETQVIKMINPNHGVSPQTEDAKTQDSVRVVMVVPKDSRQDAKNRGYKWDPVEMVWFRDISAETPEEILSQIIADESATGWEVVIHEKR